MVQLDDMRVFAALAQHGSLTAAARSLGLPKQTVSRRLAQLERQLGVQLARRTTRKITLTDVGRAYATRCQEVARLAADANRAVVSQSDIVTGSLRITADSTFGEAFLPQLVSSFLQRHAQVDLEVVLTARKVDLHEEGFDVAFRVGPPPDVLHLVASRLGPAQLWTVASPAYLRTRGTPRGVEDLADHDCIALVPEGRSPAWPLHIDDGIRLVPVPARLRVNGLAMARHTALADLGLAQLPEFAARADVDAGRLIRVLPDLTPEVGGVNLVYPHSRLLAPSVREFVTLATHQFRRSAPRSPVQYSPSSTDR